MGGDQSSVQVTNNDALGVAVDQHEIEHLSAWVHFYTTFVDFLFECLITADEELLSSLSPSVKCARNLRSAERAIV